MDMYLFIDKIHIYKSVITMHTIFTCSGILEEKIVNKVCFISRDKIFISII